MKNIKSQHILITALGLSSYFLLLFLNTSYGFIASDSVLAVFVEFLTIPFILLEFLIAIYSLIRILTCLKENKTRMILSFVLSLATIIALFLIP